VCSLRVLGLSPLTRIITHDTMPENRSVEMQLHCKIHPQLSFKLICRSSVWALHFPAREISLKSFSKFRLSKHGKKHSVVTKNGNYERRLEMLVKLSKYFVKGQRFRAPIMPPTMPRIIPATNPPPMIRLKIANGNMTTSANAPCPRIMMIAPKIKTSPIMNPIANA